MSYFEIKTIKGHDYLYLRQSVRVGKRVTHKHIAYLGRVDGGRMVSGGTISQAKREYKPEPVQAPITKHKEPKEKVKPKREPKPKKSKPKRVPKPKKSKPKREPKPKKSKKFKLPKGRVERETAGREKIDRSKEISDRERLLRKKKKKLKKFLRKKKLKKDKEPEKEFKFFPWD